MTMDALIALSPLTTVAAVSVILMLAIALRRDFRLAFALTVAGLLLAFASLPLALSLAPAKLTELLLIDAYAVYCSGLALASAIIVAWLAYGYFRKRDDGNEEIFLLLLTASLGAMILVSSSHFAMFFLGLEILSVSLFPMIGYPARHSLPLEAGFKYLLLSGIASALLLFGMALIYSETGVLTFRQLGQLNGGLAANPLTLSGTAMIMAAVGFKLSLVPFHLWTADVYQGAPAPVSAFVATVSKGAVFALWLRFWVATQAYRADALLDCLSLAAMASILAGNLLALLQTNLKRMLAYSSIAHMGYLLAALVAGSALQTGLLAESAGVYLVAYLVTSLGAFGVVSALSSDATEFDTLGDFQGLFRHEPMLASLFTVNLLSLAGIPMTLGFIGKFYVFAVGIQAGQWWLVSSVAIGSGIGVYYYLRVVLAMLGKPAGEVNAVELTPPPWGEGTLGLNSTALAGKMLPKTAIPYPLKLTLGALTFLVLWFGVFPEGLIRAVLAAVQSLS